MKNDSQNQPYQHFQDTEKVLSLLNDLLDFSKPSQFVDFFIELPSVFAYAKIDEGINPHDIDFSQKLCEFFMALEQLIAKEKHETEKRKLELQNEALQEVLRGRIEQVEIAKNPLLALELLKDLVNRKN